jgi:hypothetical protein
MGKAVFDIEIKKALDPVLLGIPGVTPGKMFGYPAYYINGKMLACLYEDGVGLKVSEAKAKELIGREGIIPFIPLGRNRMKQWVQINRRPQDYARDAALFAEAAEYVGSIAE